MPTIQDLAHGASSHFETRKRKNGEEFVALKKGSPEWMTDMVREAHGSMMPDDWKYAFALEALRAIAETESDDEAIEAVQELEASIYTNELMQWLSSNLERAGYVDEAVENYGGHSDQGIVGDIGLGQMAEKQEVGYSILSTLRDRAEEEEED